METIKNFLTIQLFDCFAVAARHMRQLRPGLTCHFGKTQFLLSENEIKFVSHYRSVTIRIGTNIVFNFIPNVGIRPIKSRSGSSDYQSAPQLQVHIRY